MSRFMCVISALCAALLTPASWAATPSRPNIVFLFADDHAVQAISAYGSRINRTPQIDRLARSGAVFDLNFCANSICAPSRACVLTGKHSHMNGVTRWQPFDGSQMTFPKLLQQAGYHTAIYGKWHLTTQPTGFDEWRVYPGQGHYYNPDYLTPTGKLTITGYSVDTTTDMALDFIKRRQSSDTPFLLMCHFKAPHRTWMPATRYLTLYDDVTIPEPPTLFDDYTGRASPAAHQAMEIGRDLHPGYDLKVPSGTGFWNQVYDHGRMTPEQRSAWDAAYTPKNEAFLAGPPTGQALVKWKYQRFIKDYLRCIAAVDENVGRILDYLKTSGLDRNTLVVYSSDQGFYLGEHGWFDKRWMYEESFRMPLLMSWPGTIPPGTRIAKLTQNIDFAPTFLEAAGVPVPAEIQGQSLVPLLRNPDTAWRDALYYHYYDHGGEHQVPRHYGIRTLTHKLIHYYTSDEWELFDLEKDPHELHSVYNDPAYARVQADLLKHLRELKQQYGDTTGDPLRHPDFDVLRNLTAVETIPDGWQLASDTDGGIALRKLTAPLTNGVHLACNIASVPSDGIRNGLIAFGPDPDTWVRAGLFTGAGQLVLLDAAGRSLASTPAKIGDGAQDVELNIDLTNHSITLKAAKTTLSGKLPVTWKQIGYIGPSVNRTRTRFTHLTIEGERR